MFARDKKSWHKYFGFRNFAIKNYFDHGYFEKKLPQDGNFKFNDQINCRVNTIPAIHGEKAVIRIIYADNKNLKKNNLGFFDNDLGELEKLFQSNHGAIIITGPTGSGKTTTLNSFLRDLNTDEINIMTVEDSVVNIIYGVNQIDMNAKISFDFPFSTYIT